MKWIIYTGILLTVKLTLVVGGIEVEVRSSDGVLVLMSLASRWLSPSALAGAGLTVTRPTELH